MNLDKIRSAYIDEGLGELDASARTCQDVILVLIARSPLASSATIKGGVVLQHISKDNRRATQDIDLDFIRYSIDDEAIFRFIDALGSASEDINVTVTGNIEELKHQDYSGKRVHIKVSDIEGTEIETKLDIGVHKDTDISQEEFSFDIAALNDSVTLLVNSNEQIVIEKLKSLLRIGAFSTRYRDIFDMYYLLIIKGVDTIKLTKLIRTQIFESKDFRESSMPNIHKRLSDVLNDRRFMSRIAASKKNWLDIPYEEISRGLLSQF